MTSTLIFIAIATILATFFGGLFAMHFKDKLHLIFGFSAGAVIGVAFFDLLPESIELAQGTFSVSAIASVMALGFLLYTIADRFFMPHHHSDEDCGNDFHNGAGVGAGRGTGLGSSLSVGSLSVHSFLDGLAIGTAFQVSSTVGIIVAVAVLVHDFSDGINTVILVLKNGGSRKKAFSWLVADSVAPAVGIVVGSFIAISGPVLGIVLALFCGFFFYIGASDLLPESHHKHPTIWTTLSTLAGAGVMYLAINFLV